MKTGCVLWSCLLAVLTTGPAMAQTAAGLTASRPAGRTFTDPPASADYRLVAGDKLRIEVYKEPQLSQSLQIIMGAGVLAALSLRVGQAEDEPESRVTDARDELLLQEGAEIVSGLTSPFAEVKRSHERPERPPTRSPPRPPTPSRTTTRDAVTSSPSRAARGAASPPRRGGSPSGSAAARCSRSSRATRRSAPRCDASCSTRPTSRSPTGPRRCSWPPTGPSTSSR